MRQLFDRSLYFILLAGALSGCASLTPMPDGRTSAMSSDASARRVTLNPQPPPYPVSLTYHLVRSCRFHSVTKPLVSPPTDEMMDMTMRPVSGRFQVVMRPSVSPTTTALITNTGRLLDYNGMMVGNRTGERMTPENARAQSQAFLRENKGSRTTMHVVSEVARYFPEYAPGPWSIGASVASIKFQDTDDLWATLAYRGVTTYGGKTVAVLDLQRLTPGFEDRGPLLIGYNLVDLATSMPVLSVLESGSTSTLEQVSCTP